jgi:hypothetical protein
MREHRAHREDVPELRVLGEEEGASFQVIVLVSLLGVGKKSGPGQGYTYVAGMSCSE